MVSLFRYTLRMPKEDAYFFYFQLEACDGLCFYSTLEEGKGTSFRVIECTGPMDQHRPFLNLIDSFENKLALEILEQKTDLKDSL